MSEEKWIIKSRAFLAMLAPLLAWAATSFGAPEGTPDFINRVVEWGLVGAGVVAYGLHLFKPDNADVRIIPSALLPPR
jgi:hypothetical protein